MANPMRQHIVLPGCFFIACISFAGRDCPAIEPEKSEEDLQKERIREWMQSYAEETTVAVLTDAGAQPAEMVAEPVFRYSDVPREIPDATLWVWTRNGRPVAFQKVEVNAWQGTSQWTICYASLADELIETRWPQRDVFKSTEPGVVYKSVPEAPAPANGALQRTLQIKALKDRFAGSIDQGNGEYEPIRVLPTPIFQYTDPDTKLPLGAIFAMTSTGTNPDVLLLLDARPDADGRLRWHYGIARLTSVGHQVKLDDMVVWDDPSVPTNNPVFETWTFYFLRRTQSYPN
jgi:hypothetical protein